MEIELISPFTILGKLQGKSTLFFHEFIGHYRYLSKANEKSKISLKKSERFLEIQCFF